MSFFRQRLNVTDVERLMSDPSPQRKIETVSRIVDNIPVMKANSDELRLAQEIVRRLAGDVEVAVRQAIAWQVAHCPVIPLDVAQKLAKDVASVAFPVLRYAALSDDDLVDAVQSGCSRKAVAVASRDAVSEKVSEAVVASDNVKAIVLLMGNVGARISTPVLHGVLDKYAVIPAVTKVVAERPELTADVVARLVVVVSEGVRRELAKQHGIDEKTLSSLVERGQDAALVLTLQPIADSVEQIEPFLRRLEELGRLTPAFLFRSLCAGEVEMFRLGLSVRGRLPLMAVDELLDDRGPLGLPALMKRCEIPLSLLPAYKAAIVAWRDIAYDGTDVELPKFQSVVLSAVFDGCLQIDDGEVEELLQNVFTLTRDSAA